MLSRSHLTRNLHRSVLFPAWVSKHTFLSGHNHTRVQSTAVQRLSGINCIALACGTHDSHPRTCFKCGTPEQTQVNFPTTFMTVHFESISACGKRVTGRLELTMRAPDKLCIGYVSSVSFWYLFKGNYTDDSSRALISTDDKPIPKGLIL